MGNNASSIKRDPGASDNPPGNHLVVGSPMEESGFIFPDHHDLLHDELHSPQPLKVATPSPAAKVPAVFRWKGGGKEVYLSGSYDHWQTKIPLSRSHDNFYGIIELPAGEHEYKFLVDGQWKVNQDEPTKVNNSGMLNNVLSVNESDFEVFDALARDSSSAHNVKDLSTQSPPGSYSQDIPREMLEDSNVHPPTLPPHLLNKVLLNQDVDLSCEPSLLPEPQHVMLNHMYALSIKDGVMALSATHRYKKKFVTTLLYKPT